MSGEYRYQKAWEEYRRLRNRQYVIFFGGGLLMGWFQWVGAWVGVNPALLAGVNSVLFPVWVVALLVTVFRFHTWNCPNCGERFFTSSFWIKQSEFLSKCRNCDLRKYTGSTFERK